MPTATITAATLETSAWVDALGYIGAIASCLLVLPQAIRACRYQKSPEALAGVSTGAMWAGLVNACVWLVWAALSGAYPAGLPSVVNGPAAAFCLLRVLRARHGGVGRMPDGRQREPVVASD